MRKKGIRRLVKDGDVDPALILSEFRGGLHGRISRWLENQMTVTRDYRLSAPDSFRESPEWEDLSIRTMLYPTNPKET